MRLNIAFNYFTRVFSAISVLLFVPAYISLVGSDGYSVIALSVSITALIQVSEIGLIPAIEREMARRDLPYTQRLRSLAATEKLFVLFLCLISVSSLLFSGSFVDHFVPESSLETGIVAACISIIGIEAGLQLLLRLYMAVLLGLERQVYASIFNTFWSLSRNGIVILLILYRNSLLSFFAWQLFSTFIAVLILKVYIGRLFPGVSHSRAPALDFDTLTRLSTFAGGMLLISLVALINTQLDRLIVASHRSLSEFSAYTLSATLASSLLIAATPIMTAVQPRLTQYFTLNQPTQALNLFRKSTRAVSLLVIPPTVTLMIYPRAVMAAWIGDSEISEIAGYIIPFLAVANMLIAVSTIVHAVALANAFTRYNNIVGLLSLGIAMPGYLLAARYVGPSGVALVYLGVQFMITLLLSFLLLRKFVGGGFASHCVFSHVIPFAGALLGSLVFRAISYSVPGDRVTLVLWLLGSLVSSYVCEVLFSLRVWRLAESTSR